MSELETLVGKNPTGCELHVNVTIVDWYLLINRTGYAISVVYAQDVVLKLLGDTSRTFKPGFPVTVYVSCVLALYILLLFYSVPRDEQFFENFFA